MVEQHDIIIFQMNVELSIWYTLFSQHFINYSKRRDNINCLKRIARLTTAEGLSRTGEIRA